MKTFQYLVASKQSMFVDISGFSALTIKLMEHGKEGAEVLADTLRFYFDPLVDAVHNARGVITGFAGDVLSPRTTIKLLANVSRSIDGPYTVSLAYSIPFALRSIASSGDLRT